MHRYGLSVRLGAGAKYGRVPASEGNKGANIKPPGGIPMSIFLKTPGFPLILTAKGRKPLLRSGYTGSAPDCPSRWLIQRHFGWFGGVYETERAPFCRAFITVSLVIVGAEHQVRYHGSAGIERCA